MSLAALLGDRVHQLLFEEAAALDERRWHDWLALFTPDCEYWVPAWKSAFETTSDPDGEVSLIGSFNIDQRSFWLNFELTMFVYDRSFTAAIEGMQLRYCERSVELERSVAESKTVVRRFAENVGRLPSPIL